MQNPPIVFIVGPSSVGKSQVALEFALRHHGEIISCDAMQVYREINIASDKPSPEVLARLPHHCVNLVSVTENFDVARFRREALKAIDGIHARGRLPVVAGGSGMYMTMLLDGIFEGNAQDEALRQQLTDEIKTKGAAAVHERLTQLDPKAAAKIHPNDPQRIIRALVVVMTTGEPISQLQQKRDGIWGKYDIKIFCLNRPRAQLYQRVEERIEAMFERGLVDEIREISQLSLSPTAAPLIGIPEVQGYLKGEYDLARAKYVMKLNTRHYVKRQLTWFRRDKRLQWIEIQENQSVQHIVGSLGDS